MSPSREGPAGAGPVAIGVEDKERNSRYIGAKEERGRGGGRWEDRRWGRPSSEAGGKGG